MDKNEERILELTSSYVKDKDKFSDEEKQIIKNVLVMAMREKCLQS